MNAVSVGPVSPPVPQAEPLTEAEMKLSQAYRQTIAPGITLVVCPGMEISWESFCKVAPPYSIALDGIVAGEPRFDAEGHRVNFNHHQNVNRLATRSTSGQVHMAIKSGLMESFRENGRPHMFIYVNDPDQDSSLAVKLLLLHERIAGVRSEPLLNKLIMAEDFIDTAAGGYPFDPQSGMMQELAWVFDPYVAARMSGRIRVMEGPEMANVIATIGQRIDDYLLGRTGAVPLDTRYEVIGGGQNWQMIKEIGFYARSAMFSRGTDAFVSFLGEENGKYHYSIGRRSAFIANFPQEELYAALNNAEGLDIKSGICWNGGDTIGGSPRRVGSSLSPREVEAILNPYLDHHIQSSSHV